MSEGQREAEKLGRLSDENSLFQEKRLILHQPDLEEGRPRVMITTISFPRSCKHVPANGVEGGYDKIGWHPTETIDLRHLKRP